MKSFQLNEKTRSFLSNYQLFEEDLIQQVQLQHRMELVEAFGIQKGMRVLELGCGQGDTTVAIADAVGENGRVVALDIAGPDYGAPLTVGQATERIKKSPLGERIDFHLEMDFDLFEATIPFEVAVFSHCSWYFKQPEDLLNYFKKSEDWQNIYALQNGISILLAVRNVPIFCSFHPSLAFKLRKK